MGGVQLLDTLKPLLASILMAEHISFLFLASEAKFVDQSAASRVFPCLLTR